MKRRKASPVPTLQAFISRLDEEQKTRFAKLAETSVGHLFQLAGGHRRASPELAQRLARASEIMFRDLPSRQLARAAIRPDVWGRRHIRRNRSNGARAT